MLLAEVAREKKSGGLPSCPSFQQLTGLQVQSSRSSLPALAFLSLPRMVSYLSF